MKCTNLGKKECPYGSCVVEGEDTSAAGAAGVFLVIASNDVNCKEVKLEVKPIYWAEL